MEQESMTTQKKLDEIANNWNKTRNPKYKKLWYDLVNGLNNIKRRPVSTDSSHKTDDGWNSVDKRR
tara:strand:+ start:23 stop:220 length:198 start_codon:yes stop_codon:yes gene_type:complete